MKKNDLENPEAMNTPELHQDIKNENAEIAVEIDEKTSSVTQELISEIEKTQKPLTEEDYNSLNREELVCLIEKAVQSDDINSIKAEVALIKMAFIKKEKELKDEILNKFIVEGGKKEDFQPVSDNISERFRLASEKYKEKKNRHNEDTEKLKQENLAFKLKILDDLKQLVESDEELKKTYDAFKTLQDKWKEIGLVPKNEINNLWQNYNYLVEKFFDKVKINKELKDLDLKKNFEAKMDLCEKAEELLLEPSIIKSFKQLQQYHDMWRDIGPVMQDKKDEIWERFSNVSEKINQRRHEYFDAQRIEQEKCIETKQALCDKVEQIAEMQITSIKEWQEQTNVLNEILKVWKTVGAAPKKQNDELWIRFKTSIDNFFNAKKEYFDKLKDEQINNYNQKLNICLQAESIKLSTDWKHATEEMIRLQQEWKKIGTVPKKYSDKIWKQFRAACDEFFNNRSEYYSNIGSKEDENLRLKKELIQEVKDFQFSEDKNENFKIIKEFQRKWMEIGHVPMKLKNDLQAEFRDVINANLDKLKISTVEKDTFGFRSKFESLATAPGGNQVIHKERTFITTKVNSLKNDIKLWENNIGFFANSKKADILKEEFQNKINKAKEDIKVLEEKLKILKEVK